MMRREFLRAGAALATLPLAACAAGAAGAEAEAAFPPVGAFVESGGLRLHYVDEGAGPPIVLVHGASGNLRDWTFSMTARLRDRFRVLAFDRPGHGYSDRPARDGDDPVVQARLIADAAASLGATRALVVGHSWGGAVATAWAVERPEQVAGLAALAGVTYPWGGDGGLLYRLGAGWLGGAVNAIARAYVTGDRARAIVEDVFAPNEAPAGYADHIGVRLALRPDTFRWNAEDIDNLNGRLERLAPRYGELTMPVEAIHGDADDTVYADIHSRPLARDVANGRLTILPGVGHMPHHVREDQVVDACERLRAAAFG